LLHVKIANEDLMTTNTAITWYFISQCRSPPTIF